MNIFVLDYDPKKAARMQCDKHVVKMPLESAQLLCSAFLPGEAPYKQTHINHPCSVWVRTSKKNFEWLVEHGLALCEEYKFRYGKDHKSREVILWCSKQKSKVQFNKHTKTPFVLCFDEKFHVGNAVKSYRHYYRQEKHQIAKWNKSRAKPQWFY